MAESILTSTKAALGVPASHTAFDVELILWINGTFSRLNELGVGPSAGFRITSDEETWEQFLEDEFRLNDVKSLMVLSVRMKFDPPDIGFVITAIKEEITKLEYLITNRRDYLIEEATASVEEPLSLDI